jgi:hypothetical protein
VANTLWVATLTVDAIIAAGHMGQHRMRNGLYSVDSRGQDGVKDSHIGVILLRNGELLGGGSSLYWFGTYTCSEGKWKGELSTQEHTPVRPERVTAVRTVGFSGTYDVDCALMNITALVGKRSIQYQAKLRLLKAD